MRRVRPALLLYLMCWCLALAPATQQTTSLNPSTFDFQALLGDPPADQSPEHQAELQTLLDFQANRTPQDVKRCQSEEDPEMTAFDAVLGPWFDADHLPITAAMMTDVQVRTKKVVSTAKKIWKRTRPPLADPRIHPAVKLEKSTSYPSGHATIGTVWSNVLAEMFPDQRDALLARGKQIGDDRVMAGMHYPSDVAAGDKLGLEIAHRLLADETFKLTLEKAKAECQALESAAAAPATQP